MAILEKIRMLAEPLSGHFPRSFAHMPGHGLSLSVMAGFTTLGALTLPGFVAQKPAEEPNQARAVATEKTENTADVVKVEVVKPARGGQQRMTNQPGTVHAFEEVELYAKASGFLKMLKVDIGSRVKKGELLAEIDSPETLGEVQEAEASLLLASSNVEKYTSQVATAEAEFKSAQAAVVEAESDLDRLKASRVLSEKQLERVTELYSRNAISRQDVDEHQHMLESSMAAERTGKAAIEKFKVQAAAARTKVDQARTEVVVAKSAEKLAAAKLERIRILAGYMQIRAPFDGIVARRNFHPGDFIRSAVNGNQEPLLRVIRTDMMRVVVKVPDLDVPLLGVGDKTKIAIDALKGREFKGAISRIGHTEDTASRTMLAEIDLPNPEGLLVDGMYGRVAIELLPSGDNLTIPSSSVVSHMPGSKGIVLKVREGRIEKSPVTLGNDDGVTVEVLAGVTPDDVLVNRPGSTIKQGDPVAIVKSN